MTASDLVQRAVGDDKGPALVAYLGQKDASATVCDAGAKGPHLGALDQDAREAFVRGLVDGHVPPEAWRRCANSLLKSGSKDDAASLLDTVGHSYKSLLKNGDLDKMPVLQARLQAMQALYLDRKTGTAGHADVLGPMFDDLRKALDAKRLGPTATKFGSELLVAVDMERGLFRGKRVDDATMDDLARTGDEANLRLFVDRLPDARLRDEAKRRVIRIHIAASPFPEVKNDAAKVEETVMRLGRNPISIADHPVTNAWVEPSKMPIVGVLVRQHVWQQTATLLAQTQASPTVSVLPELRLRGALVFNAKDISRPITLCSAPRDLDPSPCVSVDDAKLENPVAYLDKGSAFHFVDQLAMRDAIALSSGKDKFEMPVSVGGQRLLTLEWHFSYERPEDMVFSNSQAGANGPPLAVVANHSDPARYLFSVSSPIGTFLAAVEDPDANAFHIASAGAQGESGESGSAGSDGSSGGECQNGSDGGPGGDGGPGYAGGNGGQVVVDVMCSDAACTDAVASLRSMVTSRGGPGGPGGAGGPVGSVVSGGSAGHDTVTTDADGNTTTTPGCSAQGRAAAPAAPARRARPDRTASPAPSWFACRTGRARKRTASDPFFGSGSLASEEEKPPKN